MRGLFSDFVKAAGRSFKSLVKLISARPVAVRIIEISAAVSPVLFIIFSTLLQFTYPGYNPWQDAISLLVWGPYGWVQTGVFYLMAFSVAVFVIKMFRQAPTLRFKVGLALFALMGVGLIIVGIHPTGLPGAPRTVTGLVHLQAAAALIFLFPAACFLMARDLRAYFQKRWLTLYTRAAGAMSLVLIAAIAVLVTGNLGWMGMLERLIMVNGLAWLQVVSIHTL